MKVKELVNQLLQLDQEADVIRCVNAGMSPNYIDVATKLVFSEYNNLSYGYSNQYYSERAYTLKLVTEISLNTLTD